MKKLVIEGSKLSKDVASGISNYVANIFKYVKRNENHIGIESKLLLFGNNAPENNIFFNDRISSQDCLTKSSLSFFKLLSKGMDIEYDLFHSPYMFLPPKKKGKVNLLTVHDTINLERHFTVQNSIREQMLRLAIKRADFYVCISNTTREKLKEHYPAIEDDRIFTVHQGIDPIFFSPTNPDQITGLDTPYILYVGERSGYKNFQSLVRFMEKSSMAKSIKVLCVGGGAFSSNEKKLFGDLNVSNKIMHAGYVSNEHLKHLYKNAKALLYTSYHEGFGLPILEAMALGCPVICGNFSSMKEVSNGKSILVDDFSIDSIEQAFVKVEQLPQAFLLEAMNYSRSFTWEKTALGTMTVYSKLLG